VQVLTNTFIVAEKKREGGGEKDKRRPIEQELQPKYGEGGRGGIGGDIRLSRTICMKGGKKVLHLWGKKKGGNTSSIIKQSEAQKRGKKGLSGTGRKGRKALSFIQYINMIS